VTNEFCGSRAVAEEGTMYMNQVSKDVVADRVGDIHALAAVAGRRPRSSRRPRGAWRGLAVLFGAWVPTRPQSMIKAVEEL